MWSDTELILLNPINDMAAGFPVAISLSPLPYHTANGNTVPAVIVTLRVDIRRARSQVVPVHIRTSSSRPPVATRDAYVDVATRTIVPARTEKVEKIAKSGAMGWI